MTPHLGTPLTTIDQAELQDIAEGRELRIVWQHPTAPAFWIGACTNRYWLFWKRRQILVSQAQGPLLAHAENLVSRLYTIFNFAVASDIQQREMVQKWADENELTLIKL